MPIFVMHIRQQCCKNCGAIETQSSLYTAKELPQNRYGFGTNLKPIQPGEFQREFGVHVVRLGEQTIPVCSHCIDELEPIGAELYAKWQDTFKRKAAEPATVAAPRAGKPAPSLEDLA